MNRYRLENELKRYVSGVSDTAQYRRCLRILLFVLILTVTALGAEVGWTRTDRVDAGNDPCTLGIQSFEVQDFSRAEPLLRACLDVSGEQVDILIRLTIIASMTARTDEAIILGERSVAAGPDDPDARYWYGRALLESGDLTGAEREWEEGLQLSTEHAGILEGLGRMALETGQSQKAYGLLTQLQRMGVDEGWLHHMLSDLARQRGLWNQSLLHLEDALARDGDNGADLLIAGELCVLSGQGQKALDYCNRAVAVEPGAETYGGLGEIQFALGQHDSSLVNLRQAVEMDPGKSRFRFNLANNLEVLGMVDEAEIHFAMYVEMEPDDAIGHFNYGIHLDNLDRTDAALAEVSAAVRLDPQMLSALVVQAQLLERTGQYGEAARVVEGLLAVEEREIENREQVEEWHAQLQQRQAEIESESMTGKIHLLHIVTDDPAAVEMIKQELAQGADFGTLANRFSTGQAAVKGGDIGWISAADMVEPLRSEIERLEPNETSPPIETSGLFHFFRRVN